MTDPGWKRNGRSGPLDWYLSCEQHGYNYHASCISCGVAEDHNIEFQEKRRREQNRPMPLSSKEKQEAFRARNAMLGLTEVRGVFLPPALHQELKEIAAKLLKSDQRRQDQADTERREVK